MNKLFDLRFVIGGFFAIIGLLLIIYSLVSAREGQDVNRWCGGIFLIFGIIMVSVSFFRKKSQM